MWVNPFIGSVEEIDKGLYRTLGQNQCQSDHSPALACSSVVVLVASVVHQKPGSLRFHRRPEEAGERGWAATYNP